MPPDAFDSLRQPSVRWHPDRVFAAELRRRIQEELGMSIEIEHREQTTDTGHVRSVSIRVSDADAGLAFFQALFGWESDPYRAADHTEHFVINTSLLTVLTDSVEEPAVRLFFKIDDVAESTQRVRELGGRVAESSVADARGGWALCEDDQGLVFGLWAAEVGYRHGPQATSLPTGQIGHATISVPDSSRGRLFYSSLLGWEFTELGDDFHFAENAGMPLGLSGAPGEASVGLAFRVDDLDSTVARIRELGGDAGEIQHVRTGAICSFTDGRGVSFDLWQPAPGF